MRQEPEGLRAPMSSDKAQGVRLLTIFLLKGVYKFHGPRCCFRRGKTCTEQVDNKILTLPFCCGPPFKVFCRAQVTQGQGGNLEVIILLCKDRQFGHIDPQEQDLGSLLFGRKQAHGKICRTGWVDILPQDLEPLFFGEFFNKTPCGTGVLYVLDNDIYFFVAVGFFQIL